jgi:hypothetical protein
VGSPAMFEDHDYEDFTPKDLWNEVLPRLWIGGTADDDVIGKPEIEPQITKDMFDTVVTLHAWSNPADWHVRELRQAFHDGEVTEIDVEDLWFLVNSVYDDWQSGKRVLVRCLAGLNRSGLVLTLVMIMAGYSAIDAIEQIRIKRSEWVLHNPDFERWLLELDTTAWQRGRS